MKLRCRYQRLPLIGGGFDEPRPFLPVSIRGPRGSASAMMLVDSGAGDTILGRELLDRLGVVFTGEKVPIGGFAYDMHEAEVGAVRIGFGGGRFDLVSRVLAFPGRCVPVLGQRPFFERYLVNFDGARQFFTVSDRDD